MKKIQTTCNLCALACGLDFTVENNKIVNVNGNEEFPVNQGIACIKGLSLDKQHSMHKPVSKPVVNGQAMEWDEALKYTADKLNEIKTTYGGDAIGGISTGQMPLEDMALVGHVMRNELRAHLDGNTRLCMATSVVAHKQSFGFDAPPYTLEDAELSDTIVLIGANPVVAHPVLWGRIKHSAREGRKVIVIDPRQSETAMNADHYYQVAPKSDNVLMYTIANYLISNDKIDHDYIAASVNGFEEFKEFAKTYTLAVGSAGTGLTTEQITELAELIANGNAVSLWWTMGINQSYDAVRTAQSIINVALITGNMGRPGTGANSLTGQCNAMGSRAFSHQAGLFGGGDFDNPKRRAAVCNALQISDEYLIDKPTKPYNAIIEGIEAGEIKALWVMCTNPTHSWTNNQTFKKAVEKLELFIVQDIFADTETSELADVYLPVVPATKKQGTLINTERRLSPIRPVLPLEAGEMTDYQVFYKIGEYLGMGDNLKGWETPQDAFELMKKCSAGMPLDITGVEWDDLTFSKGIQWPFRAGETLVNDQRRLFEDGKYYTPSGKANLMFSEPLVNPMPINEEFNFILNTGRGTVGQWHTSVRTREFDVVTDAVINEPYILINASDAQSLNVNNLEMVTVASINGEVSNFKAVISKQMAEGQLFAPIHYIETNKLSLSLYDPFSKEPSYKYAPVKITKMEAK
ncbi:molybdopterin-dependent oxidoreductase [Mollicutes bacterium LVI A0039]|nr:molybdopterin-dependent oxidoreductase [Mollicutes bacterium LVI A0039]